MSSINKVSLVGRIGQDVEVKNLEGGKAVVNFSVATSESYKNAQGEKVENTEWHRVTAWGKLAEIVGKYTGKGDMIFIEGKLQTREFENKEGAKQQRTEIVASEVTFLVKAKEAVAA